MSKLAAAATALTGTAAASIGGVGWIKNGFGSGEDRKLLFEDLEDFQKEGKTKSDCVTSFFHAGFAENDGSDSAPDLEPDSDFSTNIPSPSEPYKSCVIIDWKREEYDNDKGNGKFTGLGTFIKGTEGFVNFNIAGTSPDENDKLQNQGIFYRLRVNESGKGEVKSKREIGNNSKFPGKKTGEDKLVAYFPSKGVAFRDENIDDYWGFFKDVSEGKRFSNICGIGDCNSRKYIPKYGEIRLSWKGEGASYEEKSDKDVKKLRAGSGDDAQNGWNNIYCGPPGDFREHVAYFEGTGKVDSINITGYQSS